MRARNQATTEFRAIQRATAIETTVVLAVLALVLLGLAAGAHAVAVRLAASLALTFQPAMTFAVFGLLAAALAFVIWSFARQNRSWTDNLKDVVPLVDFLQHEPADRMLAPNLDAMTADEALRNLRAIAARDDVIAVLVGLLPEAGYQSSSVLIKTFAPRDVIRQWPALVHTGELRVNRTLRYRVNGMRRTVRSVLLVWD